MVVVGVLLLQMVVVLLVKQLGRRQFYL